MESSYQKSETLGKRLVVGTGLSGLVGGGLIGFQHSSGVDISNAVYGTLAAIPVIGSGIVGGLVANEKNKELDGSRTLSEFYVKHFKKSVSLYAMGGAAVGALTVGAGYAAGYGLGHFFK
ncbi:hypothetical protein ACFLZX_03125 [Nanoarchaeota archaeon]